MLAKYAVYLKEAIYIFISLLQHLLLILECDLIFKIKTI